MWKVRKLGPSESLHKMLIGSDISTITSWLGTWGTISISDATYNSKGMA